MIPLPITCYNCSGTVYVFCILGFLHFTFPLFFALYLCFSGFSGSRPHLLLNPHFLPFSSSSFAWGGQNQNNTEPSSFCWLQNPIPLGPLAETSKYTSNQDVITYKEVEADEKCCVFGREHDVYVSVLPCEKGEPVCADDRANPAGGPFFFMYFTVFKRVKLRLPLTGFERALLTEVNVAPAQLHPNSWAFVRAFGILCNNFGHTPSVDVFLYFF